MTRSELQDLFDSLEGNCEQQYFIDLNIHHASDIALANELYKRGFRIAVMPGDGK